MKSHRFMSKSRTLRVDFTIGSGRLVFAQHLYQFLSHVESMKTSFKLCGRF
jgi:hypothetical protein